MPSGEGCNPLEWLVEVAVSFGDREKKRYISMGDMCLDAVIDTARAIYRRAMRVFSRGAVGLFWETDGGERSVLVNENDLIVCLLNSLAVFVTIYEL